MSNGIDSTNHPLHSSFGIYIHIPFCAKKCPYCDFNSYGPNAAYSKGKTDKVPEQEYKEALLREIATYGARTEWQNRNCRSIFFGGGTPSLFSAETLIEIVQAVKGTFTFAPDIEITMEANPGTIVEELRKQKLEALLNGGINRLSFGAQSFREEKLDFLGRIHSPTDTRNAFRDAREVGFKRINLDLMFGVPGESVAEWELDIKSALELSPEHLSTYGLTVEPGTAFGRLARRGRVMTANDDLQADMLEFACTTLAVNGFERYEISNFAKITNTKSERCRHNMGYWQGYDYLGLGAGAHGFRRTNIEERKASPVRGYRSANIPGPVHYMERILKDGTADQLNETIDAVQEKIEFFLLTLRTTDGASRLTYQTLFGEPFEEQFGKKISLLISQNLLEYNNKRDLRLTPRGMMIANSVIFELTER